MLEKLKSSHMQLKMSSLLLFLMKPRGHGMNTQNYACHDVLGITKNTLEIYSLQKRFSLIIYRPQIQKSYQNI